MPLLPSPTCATGLQIAGLNWLRARRMSLAFFRKRMAHFLAQRVGLYLQDTRFAADGDCGGAASWTGKARNMRFDAHKSSASRYQLQGKLKWLRKVKVPLGRSKLPACGQLNITLHSAKLRHSLRSVSQPRCFASALRGRRTGVLTKGKAASCALVGAFGQWDEARYRNSRASLLSREPSTPSRPPRKRGSPKVHRLPLVTRVSLLCHRIYN